jgi:hypothetical protein
VKYVAWLNTDQKYKCHLISNLNVLQYLNFIILFIINREQTEFILYKKLYRLFDVCNFCKYSKKELVKINKFSEKIPLKSVLQLFNRINNKHITIYNANKLLLFLRDEYKFKNKMITIKWGPGNHGNVNDNIEKHYIKHVLSCEEYIYWRYLLDDICCESYKQYAIDAFYKMKNVIVHTDGVNVYMSGFYGNVFIIGRYHDDVFSISSCYYVGNGEKNGRYEGLCFEVFYD